jgi:hypothetical protein
MKSIESNRVKADSEYNIMSTVDGDGFTMAAKVAAYYYKLNQSANSNTKGHYRNVLRVSLFKRNCDYYGRQETETSCSC